MSYLVRGGLLLLLVAAFGLPLVTAHSAWQHLAGLPGGIHTSALLHPESVLLLGLTGIATLPLVRLAVAGVRVLRASRRLSLVATTAEEGHHEGLTYLCVPDPRVSLFAAGFVRPRIYATQGAVDAMPSALLRAGSCPTCSDTKAVASSAKWDRKSATSDPATAWCCTGGPDEGSSRDRRSTGGTGAT